MGWQDDPIVARSAAEYDKAVALEDERINREGDWNISGAARQLGQGALLGYADEAEAGVRSLFGQPYYEELERIRRENRAFERRNPATALGLQLAGGVATGIAAPEARAAKMLGYAAQPAKGLLSQSIRSGAQGLGYGAAAGFGAGEGGFANRAESAYEGAKLGLGLGTVAPAALRTAGFVTRPVREFGAAINGRTMGTVAEDAVIAALRRDGYTPEQALQKYQQIVANGELGPNSVAEVPYALADLGQNTQRLAQSITSEPGAAQTIGNEFLSARSAGDRTNPQASSMYDRLNDYLRRAFRTRTMDYAKTIDEIEADQQVLSKQAYDAARNSGQTINVDDILEASRKGDIKLTPKQQALMESARAEFTGDVNLAPGVYDPKMKARALDLSVERFDNGKRALDDMIEAQVRLGNGNNARLLGDLRRALIDRADSIVPEYAQARNVYRTRAELLNAADLGRQFMKGDAEITAKMFQDMTPGEQQMFRIGVAREVRKMLGGRAYGEDVTRFFRKPNVQEVLDIAFPRFKKSEPAYRPREQFYNLVDAEQNMQKTYNMAARGSDTSRIQAGQKNFSQYSIFGRALRQIGSPEGALWVTITEGLQHLTRMREADAARTARLLFNSDPAVVERTLNLLQQRYGSNVALRMRRLIEPRFKAVPRAIGDVAALQQAQG